MNDLIPNGGKVPPLEFLAGKINEQHELVEQKLRSGLEHARKAGELLLQAKQQVPHGEWLPWLKANCKVGERSAQRYMLVAERWDEIEKSDTVSDLTIGGAVKLLAAPKPTVHNRLMALTTKDDMVGLAQISKALDQASDDFRNAVAGMEAILNDQDAGIEALVKVRDAANEFQQQIAEKRIRLERALGEILGRHDPDQDHPFPKLDPSNRYTLYGTIPRGPNRGTGFIEVDPLPDRHEGGKWWVYAAYTAPDDHNGFVDYNGRGIDRNFLHVALADQMAEMEFVPGGPWQEEPANPEPLAVKYYQEDFKKMLAKA